MTPINLQGKKRICFNVPVVTSIVGVTLSVTRTGEPSSLKTFQAASLVDGIVCFNLAGIEKHGRYTMTLNTSQGCKICQHGYIPDDCVVIGKVESYC